MLRAARIFFYLLLAALPLEGVAALSVHSMVLSIPLIVSLLLAGVTLAVVLLEGRVRVGTVEFAALFLIVPGLLSAVGAISQAILSGEIFRSLAYGVYFPVLFVLIAQLRFTEREAEGLLRYQLTVAAIVALVGIYQAVGNNTDLPDLRIPLANPVIGPQRGGQFGGYERPPALFGEPSWFAHYAAYAIFLGVGLLGSRQGRFMTVAKVVVNAAALVLAFSLGGYMIFLTTVVTYALVGGGQRESLRRLLAPALVSIVLLGAAVGPPALSLLDGFIARIALVREAIGAQLQSPDFLLIGLESVSDRLSLSVLGVAAWAHTPITMLFGWGVGLFGEASTVILGVPYPYSGHGWTNVLAEQGALGLAAHAAFLTIFVASVLRKHRRKPRSPIAVAASLAILLFGFAVFTGGFGFERSITLWTLLATTNVLRRSLPMGGRK